MAQTTPSSEAAGALSTVRVQRVHDAVVWRQALGGAEASQVLHPQGTPSAHHLMHQMPTLASLAAFSKQQQAPSAPNSGPPAGSASSLPISACPSSLNTPLGPSVQVTGGGGSSQPGSASPLARLGQQVGQAPAGQGDSVMAAVAQSDGILPRLQIAGASAGPEADSCSLRMQLSVGPPGTPQPTAEDTLAAYQQQQLMVVQTLPEDEHMATAPASGPLPTLQPAVAQPAAAAMFPQAGLVGSQPGAAFLGPGPMSAEVMGPAPPLGLATPQPQAPTQAALLQQQQQQQQQDAALMQAYQQQLLAANIMAGHYGAALTPAAAAAMLNPALQGLMSQQLGFSPPAAAGLPATAAAMAGLPSQWLAQLSGAGLAAGLPAGLAAGLPAGLLPQLSASQLAAQQAVATMPPAVPVLGPITGVHAAPRASSGAASPQSGLSGGVTLTTLGMDKAKALVQVGGAFMRGSSGSMEYMGGETRLVTFPANLPAAGPGAYAALISHMASGGWPMDESFTFKYEMPGSKPPTFIDLLNDDDVSNMWEAWQEYCAASAAAAGNSCKPTFKLRICVEQAQGPPGFHPCQQPGMQPYQSSYAAAQHSRVSGQQPNSGSFMSPGSAAAPQGTPAGAAGSDAATSTAAASAASAVTSAAAAGGRAAADGNGPSSSGSVADAASSAPVHLQQRVQQLEHLRALGDAGSVSMPQMNQQGVAGSGAAPGSRAALEQLLAQEPHPAQDKSSLAAEAAAALGNLVTSKPRVALSELEQRLEVLKPADLKILRFLGAGGYGEVYLCRWHHVEVAVKCLNPSLLMSGSSMDGSGQMSSEVIQELIKEAMMLGSLRHPNVVWVYGLVLPPHIDLVRSAANRLPGGGQHVDAVSVSSDPSAQSCFMPGMIRPPALVTEFMAGGSVRSALSRKAEYMTSPAVRTSLALDTARAMEYLHAKRIVHFDLKAANLLVGWREGRPVAKVADFGLSKQRMTTYVTGVTSLRGTLPWTAPEIIKSPKAVTEKVDVFSFGITLWELWTGREPFEGLNYHALLHQMTAQPGVRPPMPGSPEWEGDIPPEPAPGWCALTQQCWAEQPQDRPSFSELVPKLKAMLHAVGPVVPSSKPS